MRLRQPSKPETPRDPHRETPALAHLFASNVLTLKLRATTRCVRISWLKTTRCVRSSFFDAERGILTG